MILMRLWFLPFYITECFSEKVFQFQPDNIPSNESRAATFLTPLPDGTSNVTSFSLSLWLKVYYFRRVSYAFSYSISDVNSNELNFYIKPHKIQFIFNDESPSKIVKGNMQFYPAEWYHFGVSYDEKRENKTIIFYINGKELLYGVLKPKTLYLNGSLILGQETDSFNGGFSSEQSFCGKLSELNIYSRPLSAEEFEALYECSDYFEGDILAWNSVQWSLDGAVQVKEESICQRKKNPYKIFTQQNYYQESRNLCRRMLNTDIYLPPTSQLNDQLYNDSIPFMETCKPSTHGYSYFWLGVSDKLENGVWRNFDGQITNFTNFWDEGNSYSQECASFVILPHFGQWNDMNCYPLYKFCFACSVSEKSVTPLRLRGLCDENINYTALFRLGEISNNRFRTIEGYTKYRIKFNESENTWNLYDMWARENLATTIDNDHSEILYPLGVKKWTIFTDDKLCLLHKGDEITLSLSTCTKKEFTCQNGDCIELSQRCDLVADCLDKSDESDCQKLMIPQNYMKYLLPSVQKGEPLNVNVTLVIEKLSEIDVREMKLRVDFTLKMTWFDPRLTYSNLKHEDDLNFIHASNIWIPEYQYMNADFPSLHELNPSLIIRRMSRPSKDDNSRPLQDEYFRGDSNPLEYSVRGNALFHCLMDLGYYPFDTQTCSIVLKFKSARTILGKWGNIYVNYTGQKQILEYAIGGTRTIKSEAYNFSIATVSVSLQRRYSYYLITVYAPTFMLLLISYASLYCSLDEPDLRIMMTITTLLVLYSVYQQISETLPKTSYIKAVDVWCFFSLTVIFSKIIFHVFVGTNLKWLKKIGFTKGNSSKIRKMDFDDDETNKFKVYKYSRVLYFIVISLFTIGYIMFAIYQSSDFFNSY